MEAQENKIIKSIGNNQQEIINDILFLYNDNNPIYLDCTYSKGIFYKNGKVKQPIIKMDLEPQCDDVTKADFTAMPIESNTISSVMFDPLFLITGKTYKQNKEGSSIIAKRFTGYENFEELKKSYKGALVEIYRILKEKGIVIVKCQNTISGGKQHFSHYFILKTALELGFYPLDEFILESKSKITSLGGRWKKQRHSWKYHSFFLVLQKKQCRVNYDV